MPDDVTSKRPASQYYWGDWWKDKGLQSCSQPARGLWHEMNTLMHEGEPYGHLTVNGRPMTIGQLANLCRIPPARCKAMVDELLGAGVPSVDSGTGAIYSRRMVRDEKLRQLRADIGRANGSKGAEFGALGAGHGVKGGRPPRADNPRETPPPKRRVKPPQNPRPSSSSSSSSSSSVEDSPDGLVGRADLPPCPVEQIVSAYHDALPELPKVRLLRDKRLDAIRRLWRFALTEPRSDGTPRATNADEALRWIRDYFARARDNDWLMGRTPRVNGHQGWECDLDFLLTDNGLKHVIEKTREQHH